MDRTNLLKSAREFRIELNALEMHNTVASVNRLISSLEDKSCTFRNLNKYTSDIGLRLNDELTGVKLLCIEKDRQKYYSPPEPLFGADFENGFKTYGVFELDEAGKRFALGRSTASVFHLMRTLEVGIRALARCLNINDPIKPAERNWAVILDKIWNGIQTKWPTAVDRTKGDGALFESLYASLDAVKNPWRNATMHVENKYTDDEAEHIFISVKGFMKKLASRMDEDGKPLA
jgi:hypothetical protein